MFKIVTDLMIIIIIIYLRIPSFNLLGLLVEIVAQPVMRFFLKSDNAMRSLEI